MTEKEKIIENIKTSMAIEGCFLKENDINIMNSYLTHEITEKEGIEKIKQEFLN